MKSTIQVIIAVLLFTFGIIIGMNGSQVVFLFILAGVITCLYAIRSAQKEQVS